MKYVIMLVFIICVLVTIMIYYNEKIIKLEIRNKKLEGENSTLSYKYKFYKDNAFQLQIDNQQLYSALEFYKRPDIRGGIEINEDIKEAVKFAMIQSHPDKNNCKTSDEFIRFRELYNKLNKIHKVR